MKVNVKMFYITTRFLSKPMTFDVNHKCSCSTTNSSTQPRKSGGEPQRFLANHKFPKRKFLLNRTIFNTTTNILKVPKLVVKPQDSGVLILYKSSCRLCHCDW